MFSTEEQQLFSVHDTFTVRRRHAQSPAGLQVEGAGRVQAFTPMLQAGAHRVHGRQQEHVVFVTLGDEEHAVAESQLAGALFAPLIGDLQEDPVDGGPGHHQAPAGVVEAASTVGVSLFTLPLQVFPLTVTVQ